MRPLQPSSESLAAIRRLVRLAAYTVALLSCGEAVGPSATDVGRVDVQPSTLSLAIGTSSAVSASVLDATGASLPESRVFWSSQNAAVATVSQNGIVTAIAPGSVQVAASSGGRSGIVAVTVTALPVSVVRITPGTARLASDATLPLHADVLDAQGGAIGGKVVNWSSSITGVATVSGSGVVTAVAPGTTTITAEVDGVTGTAVVTVDAIPIAQIRVTPPSSDIHQGDAVQLTADALDIAGAVLAGRVIAWSSSDQTIAVVSSTGRVQSIAPGSVVITASSEGVHGTASITIAPVPIASISVTPPQGSLLPAQTIDLTATVKDASGNVLNGRTVAWSSAPSSVATVDSKGTVTAVAVGIATITATSEGKSGTATITVSAIPVATVTVTPPSLALNVAEAQQLTATAKDASGNVLAGRPASWSSSNASVASVSGTGQVVGVAAGATTITATIAGVSGTATVTVAPTPIASITVSPNPISITEAASQQLTAVAKDASGGILPGRTIVWSSNNANVSVSQQGVVTAVANSAGQSATITASSPAGGVGGGTPSGSAIATVTYLAVSSITVTPSPATVTAGGSTQLVANLFASGGVPVSTAGRTIQWGPSSAPSVATVNAQTGVVTGVGTGTTTIQVHASSPGQSGSATSSVSVTVSNAPVASVTVSPAPGTVHVGALYAAGFTAVTKDAGGNLLTGRVVTWTSSSPAVATVDPSTGLVTGVSQGTTTITASSEGIDGTSAVTVDVVPVSNVSVSPPTATLIPGTSTSSVQLTASPTDSAGNAITGSALGGRTTSWLSGNVALATVNSTTGLVTAVGQTGGTTTVSAAIGGTSGSSTITVVAPVAHVAMAITADSVIAPGSVTGTVTVTDASSNPLAGRLVTFTSNSPRAAVTASGTSNASGQVPFTVTGSTGSAGRVSVNIVATSESITNFVAVDILNPVASVALAAQGDSIVIPGTLSTTVALADFVGNPLSGRVVTYFSSDASVATVDPSGVITAVAPGTTDVTATSEGVTSAPLTIRVLTSGPLVTHVSVAPSGATIHAGSLYTSAPFTATGLDASNNPVPGRPVTWNVTSGTGSASVSASGAVTGSAVGGATLVATIDGVNGTAPLTIDLVPVASVTVSPTAPSLLVGDVLTPTAVPKDASGNVISGTALGGRTTSWNGSDPSKATVDPVTGQTQGVDSGTVTIAATVDGVVGSAAATISLVPVGSVVLNPSSTNVGVLQNKQITANVHDIHGAVAVGRACTIDTDHPLIVSALPLAAKTNANGQTTLTIFGLFPGNATISVTCEGVVGASAVAVP